MQVRKERHGRIIHDFDTQGNHRLIIGENASPWVTYRGIATLKGYFATTDYYLGELPHVFKVMEIPKAVIKTTK